MEEKENLKGHKRNKNTSLINTINSVFSLLFLFAGLICLFIGEILAGVCSILMGSMSIPLIADAIKKKIGASGSLFLTILFTLCLFHAIGITVNPF